MADARRLGRNWRRLTGLGLALTLSVGGAGCGGSSGKGVFGGTFSVQQIEIGIGGAVGLIGQILPLPGNGQGGFAFPPFFPDPASFGGTLPGNYFIRVVFSQPVNAASIMSPDAAFNGSSGLVGSISITDENGAHVPGIPIVDGKDRFGKDVTGFAGFPSVPGNTGSTVFMYVAEDPGAQDGSLNDGSATYPFQGYRIGQLRVNITSALQNGKGEPLDFEACTATVVDDQATTTSADDWNPTLLSYTFDRDPNSGKLRVGGTIELHFSEPVNTVNIGMPDGQPAGVGIGAKFRSLGVFNVPVNVRIKSLWEPCVVVVTPGVPWPGDDQVEVTMVAGGACASVVCDLSNLGFQSSGPLCGSGGNCVFSIPTESGPAIANAPVTPEAVYFATGGSSPGVGVIDMNGWGCDVFLPTPQPGLGNDSPIQTTNVHPSDGYCANTLDTSGVPVVFLTDFGTGLGSKAPNTPDVVKGGGRLVRDSKGDHRLTKPPAILGPITDMQVGGFLDRVITDPTQNQATSTQFNALQLSGNCTGWNPLFGWSPPVPNPPCYRIPATRLNPFMPSDFLVPFGCLFSHPKDSGLFITGNGPCCQADWPAPLGQNPPCCAGIWVNRQQIGNFLYVVDKGSSSVVVLNSNTFQVLATIFTTDPEGLAMAPDLRRLYVSNFNTSTVSVIDTDPNSLNFHTVIKTIQLLDGQGNPSGQVGPTGIAVNPDNEDVLVCGTLGNSINLIDVTSLEVRKVVTNGLSRPTEIALTQRQTFHGYATGTYFGYVVNSGAKNVVIYESGPFAAAGSIGFDDIIGPVSIPGGVSSFGRIQVDGMSRGPISAPDDRGGGAAAFLTYTDPSGDGKVARLGLTEAPIGLQQIQFVQGQQPGFRNKVFAVVQTYSGFSGQPTDIAFDDVSNYGCQVSNRKLLVTTNLFANPPEAIVPVNQPGDPFGVFGVSTWGSPRGGGMFVVNSDAGVIDIIDPQGGIKKGSIAVPGVRLAAHYFDQ